MAELKQRSQHKGHELVSTILYGPVRSRRCGVSLGVNLLGNQKICSFNCVYCQLGWNSLVKQPNSLPSSQDIIVHLKENLPRFLVDKKIDWIALSGNGEPTLHPQFAEIVNALLVLKKKHKSKIRIVCFTNGTMLNDKKVLAALKKLDECCVKLDAGWKQANIPCVPYGPHRLIPVLKKIQTLVIQSCFFEGSVTNTNTGAVAVWISELRRIKPQRVDIYTLSRRTPARGLLPASSATLKKIARLLKKTTGTHVRVCE